eukprot:scaffold660380_cov64-Prasinocladus_malaysianus.AAC.1
MLMPTAGFRLPTTCDASYDADAYTQKLRVVTCTILIAHCMAHSICLSVCSENHQLGAKGCYLCREDSPLA